MHSEPSVGNGKSLNQYSLSPAVLYFPSSLLLLASDEVTDYSWDQNAVNPDAAVPLIPTLISKFFRVSLSRFRCSGGLREAFHAMTA
jgi:hypothetical protein